MASDRCRRQLNHAARGGGLLQRAGAMQAAQHREDLSVEVGRRVELTATHACADCGTPHRSDQRLDTADASSTITLLIGSGTELFASATQGLGRQVMAHVGTGLLP